MQERLFTESGRKHATYSVGPPATTRVTERIMHTEPTDGLAPELGEHGNPDCAQTGLNAYLSLVSMAYPTGKAVPMLQGCLPRSPPVPRQAGKPSQQPWQTITFSYGERGLLMGGSLQQATVDDALHSVQTLNC